MIASADKTTHRVVVLRFESLHARLQERLCPSPPAVLGRDADRCQAAICGFIERQQAAQADQRVIVGERQ